MQKRHKSPQSLVAQGVSDFDFLSKVSQKCHIVTKKCHKPKNFLKNVKNFHLKNNSFDTIIRPL